MERESNDAVFPPRPFIKTEKTVVNSCPPIKTEPADSEMYTEFIKCEPDHDYKFEPVDPDLLRIWPDCDNLEPIGCSSSDRDSSNPSSLSFRQNGEFNNYRI